MARMWVHTAVQAHSPISRQLAPSSSALVECVLARRHFSTSTSYRSSSACSFDGKAALALPSWATQTGEQNGPFSLRAAGGFFPRHPHRLGRLSTSTGIGRSSQISTVAGKATAGSEVGVGSEAKNRDREILVQHLLVKADDVQLLIELQRQILNATQTGSCRLAAAVKGTKEGLDLSDLAEEHSLCPSKAQGGMIGWIKQGQTDPAFEEAAFNAPLNKVVRVKTKHGLHLVQVLNERKAHFLAQLQVEELHERMQDPTFLEESQLIDVREPNEIATAAIKGFEAYPLSDFGKWAPTIDDDLDPEKDTYVLCHHGMRSMQAANWLQSQGFKKLYNVSGGIHAYSTRVDSSIPTY